MPFGYPNRGEKALAPHLEACAEAGAGLGGSSSAADADEHDVSVERLRCSERLLYLRNGRGQRA